MFGACDFSFTKQICCQQGGAFCFCPLFMDLCNHGAKRLFLLSNSKLKPAIHIYNKYGFKEIKLDNYEYERGNIAFEKVLPNSD